MEITVIIENCKDCRHKDHSGAFTVGGAKAICGHSGAVEIQVDKGRKDPYHWKHRVLNDDYSIPNWCPMKQGHCY